MATSPPRLATGFPPTLTTGATSATATGTATTRPGRPLTTTAPHDAWVEYAYVIAPDRLQVLTGVEGGWQPVAEPAWTDTPDWDAIDRHAKHLRRQY